MKIHKQISRLLLVPPLLIGLGTPVRGQDSRTPIDVNVSCSGFPIYIDKHQVDLLRAVGAPPSTSEYNGVTFENYSIDAAWKYDIPPNQAKKAFHCVCSGQDVDNYEIDCPVGMKCWRDSRCPQGQDCRNKICGHAYMTTFNVPSQVKSAYFQWSPQPVPEQCRNVMTRWNYDLKEHEDLHNSDERAATNLFIQAGLKLQTSEECAATEGLLKVRLDRNMSDLIDEASTNFEKEKKFLGTLVHDLMGISHPPPDCSCMSMSK